MFSWKCQSPTVKTSKPQVHEIVTLARSGCGNGQWQQVGFQPFEVWVIHGIKPSLSSSWRFSSQNPFPFNMHCSYSHSSYVPMVFLCFFLGSRPKWWLSGSVGIGVGAVGDFPGSSTGKQWKTRTLGWYRGGEESNGMGLKKNTGRGFF